MKFPRYFQLKPQKNVFFFWFFFWGGGGGLFRNFLNCDSLRWSHIHFICIPAVHIILFCVSFLSRVDELNKLASLSSNGLLPASSLWVANAEATGSNPVEAPKVFFSGYFRNCLNCDSLRWSHTHFICIPAVHIITFSVSFLSRVDELNKLASLQCMGLHSSAGRALQR